MQCCVRRSMTTTNAFPMRAHELLFVVGLIAHGGPVKDRDSLKARMRVAELIRHLGCSLPRRLCALRLDQTVPVDRGAARWPNRTGNGRVAMRSA